MKTLFLFIVLLSTNPIFSTCAQDDPNTTYVLICKSPTAYAYHSYECRGLARCTHKIEKVSLEDAIKLKKKACGYCYGR